MVLRAMFLVPGFVLAGCGAVHESPGDATEAPDGAVETPDGAASRCSPNAPFGNPIPVPGVNTANHEYSARLSPDERTVYLQTYDGSNHTIQRATRSSVDASFGPLTVVASLGVDSINGEPTVTADGLTVYFASSRDEPFPGSDLFVAVRTSTDSEFSAPSRVDDLNTDAREAGPYVVPDGSALYFDRNGDIYRAQRSSGGGFDAPTLLTGLSTGEWESAPVVSADELTIYSSRGGDILVADRTSTDDAFGDAEVITALSSSGGDYPTWISSDGCVMYLASDGWPGAGMTDVFMASRPPD